VTKGQRVALYVRVSTDGQSVDNQVRELQAVAERHGWVIFDTYSDPAVSGAKAQRPAFDRMMAGVQRRDFDMIAAWAVDRLGRSLQNLLVFLGEIKAKGVDLYLHQQGLDTSTPAGKAMFQMLGVFAEFERSMTLERVYAGLKRARAEGKVLGRPKVNGATEDAILAELAKGTGIKATARAIGCGVGTVQRVKAEQAA
jgi:DNA invertase Pin-like site-specific DNA recombinase